MKIAEMVAEVKASGLEQKKELDKQEVQVLNEATLGCNIRHGDVYFNFIPEMPKGNKTQTQVVRLVDGNSIGSTHDAERGFKIFDYADKSDLIKYFTKYMKDTFEEVVELSETQVGSVIEAVDANNLVTHQRHKHFTVPKGTICLVTFQRDAKGRVKD